MTATPPIPPNLLAVIGREVSRGPGRMSVAVRSGSGWEHDVDADRVMASASTIKLPLLVAALREVERGTLDLDRPVQLPATRVGGCGPVELLTSTPALTVRELLTLMIVLSDNDATNLVVDLIDDQALPRLLTEAGTSGTALRRRLMDFEAAALGRQNTTTANDLVEVIAGLHMGRLCGPSGRDLAMEILRAQQFRDGLPSAAPESMPVAAKSGSIPGMRGEVALFEGDDDWVAVAVLADGLCLVDGVDLGTEAVASMARIGAVIAQLLDRSAPRALFRRPADPAIEIRRLTEADWPQVAAIYRAGIATGVATFESEVPTWARFDASRLPDQRWVAVEGERVVGWCTASPTSARAVYAGVVEHSVYVATDRAGRGIGSRLLEHLCATTESAGVWTIESNVLAVNEASRRLHRQAGFVEVGVRERVARMVSGPYAGNWCDTVLVERRSPVVD